MGLDMYLYLSKFESLSRWGKNADLPEQELLEKAKEFYPSELHNIMQDHLKHNFLSKQTQYQVGYWRKANAIHRWFIENCADGVDDCRDIYVGYDQLEDLRDTVQKVLENHDRAPELLPTQEGCFFGGTEYDDWYFDDLDYTLDLCNKVLKFLKENDGYDIYYSASW